MIAGAGDIPYLIAQHAYHAGRPVPTIALSAQVAALLSPYCPRLTQCGPGQLGKIIRVFQHQGVQQVVIVGKVEKHFFFETPWVDWRTLRGLRRLPDYRDMTILQALAAEFASAGLVVPSLPARKGLLGPCTYLRPACSASSSVSSTCTFHR